jgi:hypothetical protein
MEINKNSTGGLNNFGSGNVGTMNRSNSQSSISSGGSSSVYSTNTHNTIMNESGVGLNYGGAPATSTLANNATTTTTMSFNPYQTKSSTLPPQ